MTISLREVFNRQGTLGTNVSFRQLLATLPFGLTIGLRELHQRLPFPENEVEVMPAYITPELLGILPSVTEALNRHLVIYERDDIQQDRPENQAAIAVNNSRKALRQFLQDPNFQRAFVAPEGQRHGLDELYFTIRSRQRFHTALQLIEGLHPVSGAFFNIEEALRRESLRFTIGAPGGPGLGLTLQGYQGPNLDQAKRSQLNDARAFLSATSPERRFRGGLWRADIHFALREFEQALQEYDAIRHELSTLQLSRERRKFLAIRSSFAHLGRGDQLYKSTRDLSSDLAGQAMAHYREAVKVIQDHEVSEANYFHQEIRDYANKRMTQLSNFINSLGYSNAYVPLAPPLFGGQDIPNSRFGLAMDRVSAAQEVGDKFVSYLQAAEQAALAEREVENAIQEAGRSIEIAKERRTEAGIRRDAASARQESVKRKNGFLRIATYLDVIEAMGRTIGAAVTGNPAAAPFMTNAGAISFGYKTAASLEELSLEERLAESDLSIAESEVRIADLEVLIAKSRKSFLEEKKAFLVEGAELNLEVYYALAREYERLTEEHMEAAIKLAFLAERRAAFEGGDPTLPQVKLEYRRSLPATDLGVGGLIIAPDLLKGDLRELNESFQQGVGQGRTDFDLQISLSNDYPIEFSAFLQSGILPFKISLYDLDRFRPGWSNQRIKTVHIEIVGLGAALPNISGRLGHSGTFMVRDRASAADAERLLPTPQELDEALDIFQQGGMSTLTTKGITLWQVDPAEKGLTNLQDDPDIEEFSSYGFTGLWEFELLPSENPDIDFQNIADIIIRINGEATAGDAVFRAHIRELVKKYEREQPPEGQDEALDRVTALSMKRSFLRDAFADFLARGAMTFELRAATFPDPIIEGTKVKTVLFQAIDEEGRGVEGLRLIVSKEGASVSFDRTTLANGFSEDITADLPFLDPALRFAMEGPWRIEAADMTRLAVVHDLILFFIYELPEGAGDE